MNGTKTLLVAAGLLVASLATTATASTLEDGLIAWWRMELKQGAAIPDASGNGHDLTAYGSSMFSCQVVIFNDDGYLLADDADDLDLLGDWSVSYWARNDSYDHGAFGTTNNWMSKHAAFQDPLGGWFINTTDPFDGVRASIYGGSNCSSPTQEVLVLGNWYRLTTTFDSASQTLNIYYNELLVLSETVPCPLLASPFPVFIGGYLEQDLSPRLLCKGAMADVRIYGRALSALEVAELSQTAVGNDGTPDECDDDDGEDSESDDDDGGSDDEDDEDDDEGDDGDDEGDDDGDDDDDGGAFISRTEHHMSLNRAAQSNIP